MDGQPMGIDMTDFKGACESLRRLLKDFAPAVLALKNTVGISISDVPAMRDYGEMKANLMLAYRHLEDASMRVGKAIQAYDGGKSPLDNSMGNTAPEPQENTTANEGDAQPA